MKKIFSIISSVLLAFSWLVLLPVPAVRAAADTCTWTGATNNLWSVGSNWSGCDNSGVPEAGDSLIFPVGTSNKSMNNDLGALIFNSVAVNDTSYTFAGNDIYIQNSWQFTKGDNTVTSNLHFDNASSSVLNIGSNASGNIIDGNIILNLTAGGDMNLIVDSSITHNGGITGSSDGFQMTGTSTWTSSTANPSTFTAFDVNISSGVFECRNSACFGDATNPVRNAADGQLEFSGTFTVANDITLQSSNYTQLYVQSGAITLSGDITVATGQYVYLDISTSLIVDGDVTNNSNFNFWGGGVTTSNVQINGDISGAGDITVRDAFLQLSGNSPTWDATLIVLPGAAVEALSVNALGSTVGHTIIQSGATLYSSSTLSLAEPISVTGTGVGTGSFNAAIVHNQSLATQTYAGPVTLAGDTSVKSLDGTLGFAGPIDGVGNLNVSGGAHAIVVMFGSSANTYSGATNIDGGIEFYLSKASGMVSIPGNLNITGGTANDTNVIVVQADQIADSSDITLMPSAHSAVLELNADDTIGALAGTGVVSIGTGVNLSAGANDTSTSLNATFDSDGIFTKIGTGTLTLTGSLSGHPTILIDAGRLYVNSNFTDGTFQANSGGILGGNGSTGTTTINSGGTVNAGNSPGCMTVANLTLTSGSNFDAEIAGDTACTQYDRITATGSADLNNATLSVLPSYTPSAGTIFTIIQAGSITGTFSGLADGATFTANGVQFRIDYASNQVNLTVLGGALVPTGQNHNNAIWLALTIMLIGAAGIGYSLRRNKVSAK